MMRMLLVRMLLVLLLLMLMLPGLMLPHARADDAAAAYGDADADDDGAVVTTLTRLTRALLMIMRPMLMWMVRLVIMLLVLMMLMRMMLIIMMRILTQLMLILPLCTLLAHERTNAHMHACVQVASPARSPVSIVCSQRMPPATPYP